MLLALHAGYAVAHNWDVHDRLWGAISEIPIVERETVSLDGRLSLPIHLFFYTMVFSFYLSPGKKRHPMATLPIFFLGIVITALALHIVKDLMNYSHLTEMLLTSSAQRILTLVYLGLATVFVFVSYRQTFPRED